MPERDLYEIIGVPRTATHDEIKRAYRKLARKYHPDVNPGNKAAEERFKEVTAAFEVLSDEKRRKLYDEFGPDSLRSGFDEKKAEQYRQWKRHGAPNGGMPFDFGDFSTVNVGDYGAFDFGSIFGDLFGGARGGRVRRGPIPSQGAHAEAEIAIDLRDAVLGAERDLRVDGRTLRVKIPAGVTDGSRIRLGGQGGRGVHGGPAGDLYLEVRLRPHPHLRREGRDLYLDLPVTIPEAALGAEVELPTFEGPVRLRVPAGAQSGMQLRLRGKGMPDLRGGPRGDLYAVVQLRLPPDGSALREAVKPLAELYKDDPRAGISL
ncbi:DnaJ C-terminal domain-containing protein [Anaeromyxobacter dehalogenans]|uniref:Chaperone DnaJ-like protein n=1 Tax=Anaeromyxobacter dehalogenans (strain 2CP-C) TaxID=290397 RepID=Q2IQI5_ANADE|nr:DnaJ C-terminal domain-containing protein [Anaeromyxobacter dehalogenans]ABC81065.1 Chaperone DnaJ-like protein [Anaeromyxobacter dehalogenans 2CP-C]